MKIYVHFEPEDEMFEFTAIVNVTSATDFGKIKREFKKQFESFHLDADLEIDSITDEDGYRIHRMQEKMDVFVKGKHKFQKSSGKKKKKEKPQSININFVKIREQQEEATKHFQARRFRQAVDIYTELKDSFFDKIGAIRNIAQIYFHAERYTKSLEYVKEGIEEKQDDPSLRELYVDNLIELRRYTDAMKQIPMARQLYVQEGKKEKVQDLDVKEGRCMYYMGRRGQAFQKYTQVLQERQMQHVEALIEYAIALLEINRDEKEALNILVKVMAQRPSSRVEQTVVQIVDRDKDLKNLNSVFTQSKGGEYVQAMTWIAGVCETHGALEKTIEILSSLLKKSAKSELKNYFWRWELSKVINYIRLLRYNSAFVEIKVALKARSRMRMGGVEVSEFLKAIESLKIDPMRKIQEDLKTRNMDDDLVMKRVEQDQIIVFFGEGEEEKLKKPYTGDELIEFSDEEMQFLAMMFVLVRFLYEQGLVFPYIPKLISAIERVRLRSKKDLHLSQIRNEQAYYLYICNLVYALYAERQVFAEGIERVKKPVYVVGDSHVFSLAFREILVKGVYRPCIPLLLTGMKCFHLVGMKKSAMRVHYERIIDELPFASDVVFVIGELDCREGIPGALEKLKFDDESEVIKNCVDGYLNALHEARGRKELRVYVHPIIPVLPELGRTCRNWNEYVKKRMGERKFIRLKYLGNEVVQKILDEVDGSLKEEYQIDGTHVHPKYSDILSKYF